MKKRVLVFVMLLCMALTLLTACGKDDTITAEKAQQIVLDALGATEDQVQTHVHAGEHEGVPCYSIYVTYAGVTWEYKVDLNTGEILSVSESGHSH